MKQVYTLITDFITPLPEANKMYLRHTKICLTNFFEGPQFLQNYLNSLKIARKVRKLEFVMSLTRIAPFSPHGSVWPFKRDRRVFPHLSSRDSPFGHYSNLQTIFFLLYSILKKYRARHARHSEEHDIQRILRGLLGDMHFIFKICMLLQECKVPCKLIPKSSPRSRRRIPGNEFLVYSDEKIEFVSLNNNITFCMTVNKNNQKIGTKDVTIYGNVLFASEDNKSSKKT